MGFNFSLVSRHIEESIVELSNENIHETWVFGNHIFCLNAITLENAVQDFY